MLEMWWLRVTLWPNQPADLCFLPAVCFSLLGVHVQPSDRACVEHWSWLHSWQPHSGTVSSLLAVSADHGGWGITHWFRSSKIRCLVMGKPSDWWFPFMESDCINCIEFVLLHIFFFSWFGLALLRLVPIRWLQTCCSSSTDPSGWQSWFRLLLQCLEYRHFIGLHVLGLDFTMKSCYEYHSLVEILHIQCWSLSLFYDVRMICSWDVQSI